MRIDDPIKAERLLDTLEAALPFEVELTDATLRELAKGKVGALAMKRVQVIRIDYDDFHSGVLLSAELDDKSVLAISLSQVVVPRNLPFADAARAYQKHRLKRLKKSGNWSPPGASSLIHLR